MKLTSYKQSSVVREWDDSGEIGALSCLGKKYGQRPPQFAALYLTGNHISV